MEHLAGRVAVITGAASGIGLGLADAFAEDGMLLVLADIDATGLASAAARFDNAGVLPVVTDVGDAQAMADLATAAMDAFGRVDVVANNAGVLTLGGQWETSLEDWRWVVDVNLWGVINGVRSFVPLLLANRDGGHVVNTASVGGLSASAFTGPYAATTHAVVGLSKGLRAEFAAVGANVGVTVACPGRVRTAMVANVNRKVSGVLRPEAQAVIDALRAHEDSAMDPSEAGRLIRDAVVHNRFWVLPNGRSHLSVVQTEIAGLLAAIADS